MPITAILLLSVWDMACSFVFGALLPVWLAGRAGARPDHPILGHSEGFGTWFRPNLHSADATFRPDFNQIEDIDRRMEENQTE